MLALAPCMNANMQHPACSDSLQFVDVRLKSAAAARASDNPRVLGVKVIFLFHRSHFLIALMLMCQGTAGEQRCDGSRSDCSSSSSSAAIIVVARAAFP